MIYNLRKKFIIISAVAVSVVFALIFGVIYIASTSQLNHTMDILMNWNDRLHPLVFNKKIFSPPKHSSAHDFSRFG